MGDRSMVIKKQLPTRSSSREYCASPLPGTTTTITASPLAPFLIISFFLLFLAGSSSTTTTSGPPSTSAAEMMAPEVRGGGGGGYTASGRRCGGAPCGEAEETEAATPGTGRKAALQEINAAAHSRYISYEFLRADAVPCSRPGLPYYNCRALTRANPYSRGCLTITRCARDSGP